MKWEELLHIVGDEPVFSTTFLMAGSQSRAAIQLQLSRWTKTRKIIKLRRGLYILGNPYRKVNPHPFLISNRMKSASYISLQSALSFYGMIPEYVPTITAVTTQRPEIIQTEDGIYIYKHVQKNFFKDFVYQVVSGDQSVFIATPEKSLLDLLYLTPGSDEMHYLQELRLQHTEILDVDLLMKIAFAHESPKLQRAVNRIKRIIESEDYLEL